MKRLAVCVFLLAVSLDLSAASRKISVFRPKRAPAAPVSSFSFAKSALSPEEIAREFIGTQKDQMGYLSSFASAEYDTDDLKLNKTLDTKSSTHVVFHQILDGLEVVGQNLKVHLDKNQQVILMNGNYVSLEECEVVNKVEKTQQEALEIATGSLNLDAETQSQVREVFIALDDKLVRGYEVSLFPGGSKEYVCLVDGISGVLHKSWNRILDTGDRKYKTNTKTTRTVLPPAPVSQSAKTAVIEKPFGWVHSSSKLVAPEIKVVHLKNLSDPSLLSGKAVEVFTGHSKRALAENQEFCYAFGEPHYDEVMVYYHISELHDYLSSLGVHLGDKPLPATVRFNDDDNSFYSPQRKALFFGTGGIPDTADADIILHEYSHYIVDHLSGLEGGWDSQGGALHEGFADYFAATFFDSPLIAEFDSMAYSEEGYLRKIENEKKFPQDMTQDIHIDGEIWSGALWELRTVLGKKITDTLVIHSLTFLPKTANFSDALIAILSADQARFSSNNEKTILDVFSKRGITKTQTESDSAKHKFEKIYQE